MKTDTYLNSEKIEEQESLSPQILSSLFKTKDDLPDRPLYGFHNLMKWVENYFGNQLQNSDRLNRFVHNRIMIDGQFLLFCKEQKVSVKQLYNDSIISWQTNHNYEKFFYQGVFLISGPGFEFLHAALYHKGNQNEDEVGFFIIVSNNNYTSYINFRNAFDAWIKERERSNLHIRVMDGEDIPYTKDVTWDDVFMDEKLKVEIRSMVENFLQSKDFYLEHKMPWKRGALLFGPPGCGKTSIIKTLISMYNFKPVTIAPNGGDDALKEAFIYAEEQSPSLLYLEDIDSLLESGRIDISGLLNSLDGIASKNGLLVIATANDIRKLKSNLTDRPSRFDRKFAIPLPNQNMCYSYLKRYFGKVIKDEKIKELAKYAVEHKFSYAYLKDLYISTMFEALSNDRKKPIIKDINTALDKLINDKKAFNTGHSINLEKYTK